MDLVQLLRTLLRRWYIALPLLVLTLLAAFYVRGGVQPAYSVNAGVVVLPPGGQASQGAPSGQGSSPGTFLDFNASTQAKALTILANSVEFQQRVFDGETLAIYSVSSPQGDPFITIAVESKDRQVALEVADRVISELQAELDRQEPAAGGDSRVILQTLASPAVVAVDDSRLRAFVVALAVGSVAAVILTVLIDGTIAWRRQRTLASEREARRSQSNGMLGRSTGEPPRHSPNPAATDG